MIAGRRAIPWLLGRVVGTGSRELFTRAVLALLAAEARGLIVAGALLSITLNPFIFRTIPPIEAWLRGHPRLASGLERPADSIAELPPEVDEGRLDDHVMLVGYRRVGAPVAEELALHGVPYVVVEASRERAEHLRVPVLYGDAMRPDVLADAHLERARLVVVAAPDAYQARAILALARQLQPNVTVIVRTHSDAERTFLEQHGAAIALVGERELAVRLTREALRRYDVAHDMGDIAARTLRTPAPIA